MLEAALVRSHPHLQTSIRFSSLLNYTILHTIHSKAQYAGNDECTSTASTYVMGVTAFGCNGYQESQKLGCECVQQPQARAHTEKPLTNFFAKFNATKTPQDVSAALDLYEGKEGLMLHRLYMKYPDSIQIISRDGQAQKSRGEEL